jgi:hypothetical protein
MPRELFRYKTLAGAQRRARFENAISKTHYYAVWRRADGLWALVKTKKAETGR